MIANRSPAARRARLLASAAIAAATIASPAAAQRGFQAVPSTNTGTVNYTIGEANLQGGLTDRVTVGSATSIIDWTPTDANGTGPISILPINNRLEFINSGGAGTAYTVLNRIVPSDPSRPIALDGVVQSRSFIAGLGEIPGGSIWFYTPGGFILNASSRFDVGSLVLSTSPIDTTGGLLGPGNEIRFGQAPNPTASITIQPGAQITVNSDAPTTGGIYVAMIAPQIIQGGRIDNAGSTALIGAEAANVVINAGLFDITFTTGSNAPNPIVHTGTTTGPSPTVGSTNNIVVAALAKNSAITMLLGGQIGYSLIGASTTNNGAIVLSAGNATASSAGASNPTGPAVNLSIGTATFTSALTARASGDVTVSPDAAGQTTQFARTASLTGGAGVSINVQSNETVLFDGASGGLSLFGRNGTTGAGSVARLTVDAGGSLFGGNLLISADGTGTGGTAELSVAGTAAVGSLTLSADGIGADGPTGQAGTGGTVTLSVQGTGASLAALNASLRARGFGGQTNTAGGTGAIGRGGTAQVTVNGGSLIGFQGASLALSTDATGVGGYGAGDSGAGLGGTAGVSFTDATVNVSQIGINVSGATNDVETGYGIARTRAGGATTGGIATFAVTRSVIDPDRVDIIASAIGGDGSRDPDGVAGDGGSAIGGTITATLTDAELTPSFFVATADAIGGDGPNGRAGGAGTGGTITLTTTNSILTAGTALRLSANGDAGTGLSSGNATGGSAIVTVNGGSLSVLESFSLSANGGGLFAFATPAAGTGGAGRGGIAALRFNGGTGNLAEAILNADARGGDANVQAGAATGGTAEVTLANGADVQVGGNVLASAIAEGGSSNTPGGNGGNATGGATSLAIAGSLLVVEGTPLTLDSSASAGFSDGGTPPIGRGGTAAISIGAGRANDPEPSLTALVIEALARGGVFDQSDGGGAPGNAGTGVGGRVTTSIMAGTVGATSLLLDASGTGGASPSGGTAGGGYGGRAAFDMTAGSVALNRLTLTASAFGGLGSDGSDASVPTGSGGAAGVGANPFGADAGAFATVSGGTLAIAGRIGVEARASGGNGGNGVSSYGDPVPAGAGGGARGGIAFFGSSGTATVDAFQIDVTAQATGGDGGQVEQFASGPRRSIGGAGGAAIGGNASIELGGTTGAPNVTSIASGRGGRGGAVVSPFLSPLEAGSTGIGGRGGDGTGGVATLTLSAVADPFIGTYSEANGNGGDGGLGPTGGDGGIGRGGGATLTFDGLGQGRSFRSSAAFAFAQGRGGFGAASDGLAAGNGGDAFGGNARIEVVNGLTADLFGPIADSSAIGGDGGTGGDSLAGLFARGGNGGRGGNATAGDSELYVSLAGLTLFAGEGLTLGARSEADGGAGGSGGATATSGGTGGDAGDGGTAVAGVSRLRVEGGDFTSTFYAPRVRARGGNGGAGGTGPAGQGGNGLGGGATGGDIAILVSDIPELGALSQVSLGAATLVSDGLPGLTNAAPGLAGSISIVDDGSLAAGSIAFTTLSATAGTNPSEGGTISITSRSAPITASGAVGLTAGDRIDMAFADTGGLSASGSVTVTAGGAIGIVHSGQGATPAPSLSGTDIVLFAGTDLLATGGSFVDGASILADAATGNLVLAGARATNGVSAYAARDATLGRVAATSLLVSAGSSSDGNTTLGANATLGGPIAASDGISVTATGDITVSPAAQIVADRRIEFVSGDDILIGAGARLRAANNAPPETGSGATDPQQQAAQLRLVAGGIDIGPRGAGEISSIVLDGALEAPSRTIFLSGQAIAGTTASTIAGANLFARVVNAPAPGATASNDGGLLPAGCVEGNVCLGRVLASNLVRIGETGFVPNALRLVGGIDAVDVLLRTRGTLSLGAAGGSDFIRASSSLTIASTGSDIIGDGALAISSGGSLSLAAAQDIAAPGLTLQTPATLALFAGRNITLGGLDAAQLQTVDLTGAVIRANGIEAAGAIRISGAARVTGGDLIARAGTGLEIGSASAPSRNIDLASTAGLVSLGSTGSTTLGTPVDVTLAGADVSVGDVSASGALSITARQGITVIGATRGGTVAFTSGDLTIGANATLGGATTSAISLTSNTGRAALGGSEGGGLWRLTDAELDRIRSNGDLTVTAPAAGQGGAAFSLASPSGAAVLVETLSFSGSQIGTSGTFRVSSGGSIGVIGQATFDGMTGGQTVLFSAANDIALAAESGGIALRDAAGGLAGTLRLEAAQVHALTGTARSEAANLDLQAFGIRLATQDAIARDEGFFQAGAIVARVSRAFFVQNTGATIDVQEDRRGLTVGAGELRIEATGNTLAAVAINGRILRATTGSSITGADVIPATAITGTLDPQSTINGCLIADPASCTPSRPRAPIDVALNISRDVITEEVVETAEEAARKAQSHGQSASNFPQPLIEILEVPPRPYDPVIDEPVTGTGNDDLWEQPAGPPGG